MNHQNGPHCVTEGIKKKWNMEERNDIRSGVKMVVEVPSFSFSSASRLHVLRRWLRPWKDYSPLNIDCFVPCVVWQTSPVAPEISTSAARGRGGNWQEGCNDCLTSVLKKEWRNWSTQSESKRSKASQKKCVAAEIEIRYGKEKAEHWDFKFNNDNN